MKFSKILTVVLLVSVLAISLIACSTSKNNKDEKQSIDSSISTLMATEPNSADEASKLHNQLMEKENEILSTDKALWEKVFMASNKDNPMIEDGTNYGDFLLKTIEGAKDQFTDVQCNHFPVTFVHHRIGFSNAMLHAQRIECPSVLNYVNSLCS